MTRKEFNLRRERMKRDLTQAQLAEMAGYTTNATQKHEYADVLPKRIEIHYKNILKNVKIVVDA